MNELEKWLLKINSVHFTNYDFGKWFSTKFWVIESLMGGSNYSLVRFLSKTVML